MGFKRCKLINLSLRKLEYSFNPVPGSVNIQIKTGSDIKVPIDDLSKPCLVEWVIEMTAENGLVNLKCLAQFHFKVDGTSNDYDIEELRNYVSEHGNPIAYKKMSDIVKTITGFSNATPLTLPSYQTVMQKKG